MTSKALSDKCEHTHRVQKARGLCTSCYSKHQQQGTLDQFPVKAPNSNRPRRMASPVFEEYVFLRDCGLAQDTIAEKLGIHRHSLVNNILRWRKNGLLPAKTDQKG